MQILTVHIWLTFSKLFVSRNFVDHYKIVLCSWHRM